MNNSENSTSDSRSLLSVRDARVYLTIIFYTLVLIVSVVGNVLILSAVCLKPRFSRPANFMLANLSVTSLYQVFVHLFSILLKSYPILTFGPWTCHLFPVVRGCALAGEGFTVMCISLERSKALFRPLERMSGRKVGRNILAIWITSLVIEIPHGLSWKYTADAPNFRKCINTKEFHGSRAPYILYVCSYFLVAEFLPMCFMIKEALLLGSRLKFLMSSETEWSEYQMCK